MTICSTNEDEFSSSEQIVNLVEDKDHNLLNSSLVDSYLNEKKEKEMNSSDSNIQLEQLNGKQRRKRQRTTDTSNEPAKKIKRNYNESNEYIPSEIPDFGFEELGGI